MGLMQQLSITARYKKRAEDAEAKLAQVTAAMQHQQRLQDRIIARLENRAALISIVRTGRTVRFGFVRNGKIIHIDAMSTWDDDVADWKRQLLDAPHG